jgi:hypothetical protein
MPEEPPPIPLETGRPTPRIAFLSHHHEDLSFAQSVGAALRTFGFAPFIAHRDLESGTEWRDEIQRMLRESALLIAIVTPKFATSDWTDQEVGFAIGRDVPVVPVSVGLAPYGFLGHIQGVRWQDTATGGSRPDGTWSYSEMATQDADLGKALVRRHAIDRRQLLGSLESSSSWHATKVLLLVLGDLTALPDSDVLRLAAAAAANGEIYNSSGISSLADMAQARVGLFDPKLKEALRKRGFLPGETSDP